MRKSFLIEKNEMQMPICASKSCGKELKGFEIQNQERFCRHCRISGKVLEWKCRTCNGTMSNSTYRETRLYCRECKKEKSVDFFNMTL